jgi:hypothetical protein
MKYVCAPAVRSRASASIFGPSAAIARSAFGTGVGAVSRPSKNARIVASGLAYSAVASGWPMPTPSRKRPGYARVVSGVRGGDGGRVVRPDVEDPGRDDHRRRRLEERVALLDRRARPDPDGRVARGLDAGQVVDRVHVPSPDAEPSERGGHGPEPCTRATTSRPCASLKR